MFSFYVLFCFVLFLPIHNSTLLCFFCFALFTTLHALEQFWALPGIHHKSMHQLQFSLAQNAKCSITEPGHGCNSNKRARRAELPMPTVVSPGCDKLTHPLERMSTLVLSPSDASNGTRSRQDLYKATLSGVCICLSVPSHAWEKIGFRKSSI